MAGRLSEILNDNNTDNDAQLLLMDVILKPPLIVNNKLVFNTTCRLQIVLLTLTNTILQETIAFQQDTNSCWVTS